MNSGTSDRIRKEKESLPKLATAQVEGVSKNAQMKYRWSAYVLGLCIRVGKLASSNMTTVVVGTA